MLILFFGMLVEVIFIETVPNNTSTNILIYILLSILLRLTGKRDRLIGCIEKESILGKDISTCLPVSLNLPSTQPHIRSLWKYLLNINNRLGTGKISRNNINRY